MAILMLLAVACGTRKGDIGPSDSAVELSESPEPDAAGRSKLWCNHVGRYGEVFNDSNYVHYASAEQLGIDPIYTLNDAYFTRRPLIRIESGENYTVENLTHSMPFLVPEAALLLDDIGREFGDLVEARGGDRSNRIVVTSVLRSPYSVRKLRRVNRNAVDSSTHMFATTFDISWSHFSFPDSSRMEDPVILKGILAEVLLKKRDEGRCFVKYERKSPCFHITVAR